jgi:hypothetical protein
MEHTIDHPTFETVEPPNNSLRTQQRAPPGVGVKDLRPLRGRPYGPIPDPNASSTRPNEAENSQQKINYKNRRLTGPAPSGMTCGNT